MKVLVGPVLTKGTGYAFATYQPEVGERDGFVYGRMDQARYARRYELKSPEAIGFETVDEFKKAMTLQ